MIRNMFKIYCQIHIVQIEYISNSARTSSARLYFAFGENAKLIIAIRCYARNITDYCSEVFNFALVNIYVMHKTTYHKLNNRILFNMHIINNKPNTVDQKAKQRNWNKL